MVLKRVTIQDIDQVMAWSNILGESISLSKTYKNPTRMDRNPGCKFFIKNNEYVLMDFSKKQGMNCAQCLMKMKLISYSQALEMLFEQTKANRFIPVSVSNKVANDYLVNTPRCEIKVTPKPFTKEELLFWKKFGVKKHQLERDSTRVYSVKSYTIKYEYNKTFYPNDMVFAYCENLVNRQEETALRYKIYFPERNKPRFKNSLSEKDVWLVVKNPKKWIIQKSHKDFLSTESLLEDTDWSIGMVQNEGSFPKIQQWQEATQLFTFFDNDNAGIKAAELFKEYYINASSIMLEKEPGIKDLCDYINEHGLKQAKSKLLSLLEHDEYLFPETNVIDIPY